MNDELDDFIRKNRSAFDDREVPKGAWSNIQRALGFTHESVWNSVALWRAAAILFMAMTTYLLIPSPVDRLVAAKADISVNEFRDVEEFYTKQISEKVTLISTFQRSDGLNGFTNDFHQLEAMYMVLKEEMKTSPSDKVKDALVLNLLIRIDLLNQQLHKLEKEESKPESKSGRSV